MRNHAINTENVIVILFECKKRNKPEDAYSPGCTQLPEKFILAVIQNVQALLKKTIGIFTIPVISPESSPSAKLASESWNDSS